MKDSRSENSAKVYLVGAGPGDPGLMTLRGKDLLSKADIIIYDYLANERLLRYARPDAELVYVGKQGGDHTLSQTDINRLIVEKARTGGVVVRLKGGDPFVFGRGGEEALELVRAGIRFEIVPGVTAGIAAPAYAGIPVTHRDFASDFALITGHESSERSGPSQVDWAALGRWQGTLAFYMGVKNLPEICRQLRENGMNPDAPAAIIRWGTTPQQQTLTGTLATLPTLVEQHQFKPPAIILIGRVVALREELAWFENRPLFGQTIVVTRSRTQASVLVEKLDALGAETIEYPTIKIIPPRDSGPLLEALETVGRYDWLIFTSVNGVESIFEHLTQIGKDSRALGGSKICAIGPATAETLTRYGIRADLVPEKYIAESIFAELDARVTLSNKTILIARADIARADLPDALRKAGAQVDEVVAYHTVPDEGPKATALEKLKEGALNWITFTSSSTVTNFFEQIPVEAVKASGVKLASIGPVTSATLEKLGLTPDVEATEFTIDGLIEAIIDAVKPHP